MILTTAVSIDESPYGHYGEYVHGEVKGRDPFTGSGRPISIFHHGQVVDSDLVRIIDDN